MKPKWKADEKRMLIFTSTICLLLLGAGALYEWNNRVPDLKIPQTEMPEPNAFDFYAQAAELYQLPSGPTSNVDLWVDIKGNGFPSLYSKEYLRQYPLARKQKFLKANQKILQLLQQGAEYSYLQPSKRDGKDTIDHYKCRHLARLLLIQSHAYAQAGDWDSAADSLLDVLRFSYQIQNGAALRGGLGGIAMRVTGEKELQLILPQLSAQKAKLIARQIEDWEANRVLQSQILEEEKRAMQAVILQRIRKRDFRPLYVGYGCQLENCGVSEEQFENDMNRLNHFLKLRLAWMNKPNLIAEYSRCMDWHIAQSKLPFPKRSKTSPFPESEDAVQNLIHPQYQELHRNFARQEINTALTLTMVALHAYKLGHKKYPQKLSALVPEYLKRVPLDPCSAGKELRYRLAPLKYIISTKSPTMTLPGPPSASGIPSSLPTPSSGPPQYIYGTMPFTLYSVGFNARDDAGIPYQNETTDDDERYSVNFALPENAKVDIVAGIN